MVDAKSDWKEYLRLFTPFMLIIISLIGWGIKEKVADMKSSIVAVQCQVAAIDDKMFKHLTNDEIHSPRSLVVNKPEFQMYQAMRDKQMDDVKEGIRRIENALLKYVEKQ